MPLGLCELEAVGPRSGATGSIDARLRAAAAALTGAVLPEERPLLRRRQEGADQVQERLVSEWGPKAAAFAGCLRFMGTIGLCKAERERFTKDFHVLEAV